MGFTRNEGRAETERQRRCRDGVVGTGERMIDADKAEFIGVLVGLAAIKPGKDLTREAYEIWWLAMRDNWTLEHFKSAASHLASSCEFMPSPYHFEQLRKAARQTAGEAFAQALQHVRTSAYRD